VVGVEGDAIVSGRCGEAPFDAAMFDDAGFEH
jgi:hypothetical protein